MMEGVVLATKNRGKIEEFTYLLRGVFEKILTLNDLGSVPDIV
ncbi:MAG: non-canonical purine NTP pyrophosphatase, partial [Candidatus Dadabacteria bacterium]